MQQLLEIERMQRLHVYEDYQRTHQQAKKVAKNCDKWKKSFSDPQGVGRTKQSLRVTILLLIIWDNLHYVQAVCCTNQTFLVFLHVSLCL